MSALTPAQARAVDSEAREILCVAGPGAGKTTVLVRRICRLLEAGVQPEQIVALTFTNAAARELEARLYSAAVDPRAAGFRRLGYCGTLHGFALRMLKEHGAAHGYGDRLSIIGQEAADDLIMSKAKQVNCKTRLGKLLELKAAGRPKRNGGRLSPEALVIIGYYDDLKDAGMVDFDIMLSEFVVLMMASAEARTNIAATFTHLFVDEVQDSSATDWQIYDMLPVGHQFYLGEPVQAIYGFRGGAVAEMIARSERAEVILLEENFRSHDEVCNAATKLIGHNSERIAKATIGMKGPGGAVFADSGCENEGDEIARVAMRIKEWFRDPHDGRQVSSSRDLAVLARTNAVAAQFREGLAALGVPVAQEAKSDVPKDWALARQFVTWMANPDNDTLAFFYIIALRLHRGDAPEVARAAAHVARMEARAAGAPMNAWFGEARPTIEGVGARLAAAKISAESRMLVAQKIRQLGRDADLLELALAMNLPDIPAPEERQAGVEVTTIHGAKGREWDVVFLVGFEDEIIPGRAGKAPKEGASPFERSAAEAAQRAAVEEERRLAYVGLTRARLACYITSSKTRKASWGYQPIEPHTPSRFVKEMLP